MRMQAVYGVLKEAEHRSTFYIPYWDLPLADKLVPRQIEFARDIKVWRGGGGGAAGKSTGDEGTTW